jgi:putative peptidoglycan lipid II flippase
MDARASGLLRSATIISSLTLLSRLLGFIRDMAIAYVLGAGYKADVFFVAFRIPNLFRRLYGEGSLSLPFMPELGRADALGDDASFSRLAADLGGLASSFYLGLVLLGVMAAPVIVSVMAPGFLGNGAKWQLAVSLSRYLFPYVFCIGVAGFAMAILNTRDHFGAPAAAPSLLNLSMLALLGIGSYFEIAPEWALTWGVILGGALQLGLQWLWVRRLMIEWSWSRWWRAPEAIAVFKLLVPTVFGAAVYHLNIFVATLFASLLTAGSISYLYYAERLIQFPLGLFAGAIGTSVLPRLTRQSALEEWSAFRQQVAEAIELIWFLTIPAAAGLWVIRVPLVHLLFQRGEFNEISTMMTAEALGYYSLGLWAVAGFRVVVGAWYALERAYTTVWTGIGTLALNAVLSAFFIGPMQHGGLALATSIAAIVNLFLLLVLLGKRLGGIHGARLLRSGGRCLAASLIMAIVVGVLCRLSYSDGRLEGGLLALALACWVAAGVCVYLGSILLLGVPDGVKQAWEARGRSDSVEDDPKEN